ALGDRDPAPLALRRAGAGHDRGQLARGGVRHLAERPADRVVHEAPGPAHAGELTPGLRRSTTAPTPPTEINARGPRRRSAAISSRAQPSVCRNVDPFTIPVVPNRPTFKR